MGTDWTTVVIMAGIGYCILRKVSWEAAVDKDRQLSRKITGYKEAHTPRGIGLGTLEERDNLVPPRSRSVCSGWHCYLLSPLPSDY